MAKKLAPLPGLASGLQTPKLGPGDELSTSFKLPQDVVAQTFVANMQVPEEVKDWKVSTVGKALALHAAAPCSIPSSP